MAPFGDKPKPTYPLVCASSSTAMLVLSDLHLITYLPRASKAAACWKSGCWERARLTVKSSTVLRSALCDMLLTQMCLENKESERFIQIQLEFFGNSRRPTASARCALYGTPKGA